MLHRLLSTGAALSLFACVAATAQAAPVDAKAFFEKHRAYVGWQDGDLPGLELSGVVERTNSKGATLSTQTIRELRRGMAYRAATSPSGEKLGSEGGFTGRVVWYADENNFTVPIYGDAATDALARAALFSESFGQLHTASVREESLDGVPCEVARISLPNHTDVDLFEDASTGAYKRLLVDPGYRRFEIDVDDYAELIPGKRFISAWHSSDQRETKYRYTSARVSTTLSDAQLHPPSPTAKWTFGTGAISIDEGSGHDRFLIYATINGQRGRFIFDTGADAIYVTGPFAARAHFKHVGSGTVGTFYGEERTTYDVADQIVFEDGSVLANPVVNTSKITGSHEEGIDGLIGSGILTGTIATLDVDHHQLTLDDPEKNTVGDAPGAIPTLVDLSDGVPILPATLNGSLATRALLDSGSPAFVYIDGSLRPKVSMLVDDSNLVVQLGYRDDACGHIASIRIGPIDYQNPSTCFTRDLDTSDSYGALIGYDFIKNFNITFDYPAGKIVFQKRSQ